jgi:hypothetical protein
MYVYVELYTYVCPLIHSKHRCAKKLQHSSSELWRPSVRFGLNRQMCIQTHRIFTMAWQGCSLSSMWGIKASQLSPKIGNPVGQVLLPILAARHFVIVQSCTPMHCAEDALCSFSLYGKISACAITFVPHILFTPGRRHTVTQPTNPHHVSGTISERPPTVCSKCGHTTKGILWTSLQHE